MDARYIAERTRGECRKRRKDRAWKDRKEEGRGRQRQRYTQRDKPMEKEKDRWISIVLLLEVTCSIK